jgi:hypothetical protein
MNDQQLLRYCRHILLNEIGIEGQECLLDGLARIIGLGAGFTCGAVPGTSAGNPVDAPVHCCASCPN